MKTIEALLEPLNGYLISITRNAVEGWYEMELGIPKGWVFNENNEIKCEVLNELESGKIIKISPKNVNIVIDDLITFVFIIMETNKKIAEKEKEFTDRMAAMRDNLEREVKEYYDELDKMRENSFKNLNIKFEESVHSEDNEKKRHRRTKAEIAEIKAEKEAQTAKDNLNLRTHVTAIPTKSSEPAIKIDHSHSV